MITIVLTNNLPKRKIYPNDQINMEENFIHIFIRINRDGRIVITLTH